MRIRNAFIKLISFTMVFIMLFSLIPAGTVHAYDKDPATCTHEIQNLVIGSTNCYDQCTECGKILKEYPATISYSVGDDSHCKITYDFGVAQRCDYPAHSFGPGTVTKEPTCASLGEGVSTCERCGYQYTYTLAKSLEHTWSETITTQPTYRSEGVVTLTCTICGETITGPIPKLVCTNHVWDEGKIIAQPTYHATGTKTYTCQNCGKYKTETIPKLVCTDHAWAYAKVTKEATYKEAGIRTYTCLNCGQTKTETIPKLTCTSHTWNSGTITTAATYQAAGVKTYTCTKCGKTKTETIPKLTCTSHAWDNGKVTKEATYNSTGEKTYTCKNCGQTKTETIPKVTCTNHAWDNGKVTKEATYKATGEKTYTCKNCGKTKTEEVPKLTCTTHSWDAGKVTTEATYKAEGVKTYTCKNCGKTKTEKVPKLTCTTHSWDAGKIITKATYKDAGEKLFTCKNCGKTKTEVILKLVCTTHAWDAGKVTTKATYKDEGEKLFTCKNCGQTKTEVIPKLVCTNHAWDKGKVTKEATYKAAGEKTYTCQNCEQTKTEPIPKLVCTTHAWDAGKVTKEATYKKTGEKKYTCKNCGETKTETIPVLKCTTHAYGSKLLTSAGGGVYYYVSECKNCGEVHSALHEHDYKWVTIKPATESETGTERYLCEECGYYTLEREIPKVKAQACTHPYPRDFVETVPATCSSYPKGNVVCKQCGEVIAYDYESSSRGYNPDNHVHFTESVRVEPTYKTNGTKRFTCDGCGYYYTESIPKLECAHDGRTYVKDYDKEAWVVCKLCGEKLRKTNYKGPSCSHIGTKKTQVLVKAPTSTEWGEAAMVCECGKTVSTEKLHPYSEYQVTKSDGSTVTVYGWFDYEEAREIADLTNAYRLENGLNALSYNDSLQSGSDARALETIASFSHTRPDGTRWNTTMSEWTYGGENLASGQTSVESAMRAWKESPSHNANLLYGLQSNQTPFKGISVGVFHRMMFTSSSKPYTPYEYTYYTQHFTF